ncbi:septal ring lytic transglycosylase RlpA family protein [Chitinophaga nivalis]|uniref:Probable endolytic peptidoglycan transglycosylase RlpA n=1 Tax=Chitinophaga nivalis TaxID=2991709 RepID=A0ABT3IV88_9BACT|nr:septal ring lytic transglycosylase RlpA family protein [Chitinophaga nivalis]MCW3462416.1 septal ring lytic transglycosylase RlpA family protein [Chitinophaga nivalis]MCW3487893.1 septal ring lytic transglycosylase RlpA family protein [Chitinophaga nivalis]
MKTIPANVQRTSLFIFTTALLFCTTACSRKITQTGKASYYADSFDGRRTASGEVFRQNHLTAAHKSLPFGTKVTVINVSNGKSVKVRITDRGPFAAGRIIDLSRKAAARIGMINTGVANVEIKYKKKK